MDRREEREKTNLMQILSGLRVTRAEWVALGSVPVLALIAYSSASGATLWNWLQLLIVPATIAGFSIWFNWLQKERDRQREEQQKERDKRDRELQQKREKEREVREATINALQENKERIAYVAYLAKEPRQGDIFEDADFRAKFWPALCLAAVFETSDRTNAVIRDALKSAVKNPKDCSLIEQTLADMKQAFDDLYEDSEGYEQKKNQKDKGPIDNFRNFERRRRQLKALIDTLGFQNYAPQKGSEVTKE